MNLVNYQRFQAAEHARHDENGNRIFFMDFDAPQIPQPPAITFPAPLPAAAPAPNVLTGAGGSFQVGNTIASLGYDEIVGNLSLDDLNAIHQSIQSGSASPEQLNSPLGQVLQFMTPDQLHTRALDERGRNQLSSRLLSELDQLPAGEEAELSRFESDARERLRTQVLEDYDETRQQLMEELNARGILESTGDQGESGLRGRLEEAKLKSLTSAELTASEFGENIRATRRGERLSLYNAVQGGLSAEGAERAGLTPIAAQIGAQRNALEIDRYRAGPLAQYQAQVADRSYRSGIAQANASARLASQNAQAQTYTSLASGAAGAGGLYLGAKSAFGAKGK